MSNYVYEGVVSFNIRDMGYAISTVKQGIPGGNTITSPTALLTGLLIVIDKSLYNLYKDTLSGSDFTINIKLANSNNYASGLTFSSITCVFGEEYENIDYVTLYGEFSSTPSAPTSATSIELIYIPNNATFRRENIPCKTAGGRVIGRHVNWEGSVIYFGEYGTDISLYAPSKPTTINLYVPDAKFRDFSYKEISSDSGRNTQLHIPILEYNNSIYLFDLSKSYSQPFTDDEFLTDKQLQTKLDSVLNNGTFVNDFNAQDGTDEILLNLDATSTAALAARDIVPTGLIGCNLPNIYELSVIWLESDNIDSIDPTINEHSKSRLGSPSRFKKNEFWTCTEVQDGNDFHSLSLGYSGYVSKNYRNYSLYVLPV